MLLKNQNIIMLALPRFDDAIESNSFVLAKQLARNNVVYYIDNPFTIKDRFSSERKQQLLLRKNANKAGWLKTETENLRIVVSPFILSINFLPEGALYQLALKWNEAIILNRIKKILKQENISDYIFINSFNFHFPGIGTSLKPKLRIYHCVDPLIKAYDAKHGVANEKKIIQHSDVVLCTSKQLYEEKKQLNPNCYFIPNAADVEHSKKALLPECKVSDLITPFPKPIIGYFGAIERRIDYEMMRKVMEKNQDKSFVFVGPADESFIPSWFKALPNLHLVGSVAYKEMPSVIKGFDVAIIPFKKDAVSATIFPLKLFEYLGAGKPVVATDFNPNLSEFTGDVVQYCTDDNAFSNAIQNALNEPAARITQRLKIAEANTWEERFTTVNHIILEALKNKM